MSRSVYGGRSSMGQHLSDLAQELQYERYLNLGGWLNFTTPQQAYAWRQKEYQLRLLMNRAEWANYTSPDQYLAFVQRDIAATNSRNAAIMAQAMAYRDVATAAQQFVTVQAEEQGPVGGIAGIQQLQAAAAGIPAEITTTLAVSDEQAVAELARYRAMLTSIPPVETTRLVAAAPAQTAVTELRARPRSAARSWWAARRPSRRPSASPSRGRTSSPRS